MTYSITDIVLNEGELSSDDDWTVIDSMAAFATIAAEVGGLVTDELPPEVMWSSQLTYYQSQVNRNGHFLFVCNSRWQPRHIDACRSGLMACGADDYLAVLDDLVTLVNDSGVPWAEWMERKSELEEQADLKDCVAHLDDRYFAMGEHALLRKRVAWLRALPKVRAVPPSQINLLVENMTADNPTREARVAAIEADKAELRKEYAREQNRRYWLDDNNIAMGERMLAKLRRPFRGDPKRLAPLYEILTDKGIAWPVESDAHPDAYLLLIPDQGTAVLTINFEPVSGPKPMPADLCAYAREQFATAVPY